MSTSRDELKKDVPAPLDSILEKESREEAVKKHQARKQKETVIVPPTCTEVELQEEINRRHRRPALATAECSANGRRIPRCRNCGKPMSGHQPCRNNQP
ncbi:hypothetical protein P5673_025115 [Acropora cervicornis]|uniref:Uncharacterized protein n=1 Tax=Acropora cervicornis TaxID=6130 RepID=A0AAD9UXK3_ACRCE|nr:hypothetical protein P5673_025115 [Acropora cervicornis]